MWQQLQRYIPAMFRDVTVEPSLLHGDLWSGNAGEMDNQPGNTSSSRSCSTCHVYCVCMSLSSVAYDPASFYGHHEFDLAITTMFGGFSRDFYTAYHSLIPQAPGFAARSKLYLLFHYLNHWLVSLTHTTHTRQPSLSESVWVYLHHIILPIESMFLLCHRNHFGSGYRSQSIEIMKKLVNEFA